MDRQTARDVCGVSAWLTVVGTILAPVLGTAGNVFASALAVAFNDDARVRLNGKNLLFSAAAIA